MTDHEFKAPAPTTTAEPDETTTRLAEIRERANAATDGPWMFGQPDDDCTQTRAEWMDSTAANPDAPAAAGLWVAWTRSADRPGVLVTCITGDGPTSQENAEFIAHARQDVPWLLAEVERLTGERDRARDLAARLEAQVARVAEAVCEPHECGIWHLRDVVREEGGAQWLS